MTHVLRKSYGAHSAGTEVHQVVENEWYVGETTNVVPNDLVVKLRPRTRLQTQSEKKIWGKLYGDRN